MAVWEGQRRVTTDLTDILYSISDTTGQTWQPPRQLNGSGPNHNYHNLFFTLGFKPDCKLPH